MNIKAETFINILENIKKYLEISGNIAQANFLEQLLLNLRNKEIDLFVKKMNSVEMWGGAGAVWEVFIGDPYVYKQFQHEIVNLIKLMEENNIKGRGIDSIKKMFMNELLR